MITATNREGRLLDTNGRPTLEPFAYVYDRSAIPWPDLTVWLRRPRVLEPVKVEESEILRRADLLLGLGSGPIMQLPKGEGRFSCADGARLRISRTDTEITFTSRGKVSVLEISGGSDPDTLGEIAALLSSVRRRLG